MTTTPQAALLREAAQNALITLDGIASANPRDKADFETPDEWIAWAKSRARFAADALRAPVAQEVYAERILRQMLHESDQTQSMQVEPALTEEEIWFIASDGMRSAAGGIYQSSVIEFARAVEQAVLAKLQPAQDERDKLCRAACEGMSKEMLKALAEPTEQLVDTHAFRVEPAQSIPPGLRVGDSHMESLIEAAIQGHAGTRDAMRWLVRQIARVEDKPAQAGELPDERAAFEAEMRCSEEWGHRSLKKRTNGKYENWQVDLMWGVWQSRAALSARKPAVPMTPESIHMIGEQLADCCYGPAGGPMECYQFEPGALVEFVRAIEGYGIGLEVKHG